MAGYQTGTQSSNVTRESSLNGGDGAMSNFMSYKGYTTSMVYDTEDKILAREL